MTSHSAQLLTSYYGDMSRLSGLIWPKKHKKSSNWMEIYAAYLQFKQTFTNFEGVMLSLEAFKFFSMTTFMAFFLELARILCHRFVFEAKGKNIRGSVWSLRGPRRLSLGHFSELWLFLPLSLKNLLHCSVFCRRKSRVSQSSAWWMATLMEICDIGHDWRVCVHIVAKMDTKVLQSSWVLNCNSLPHLLSISWNVKS